MRAEGRLGTERDFEICEGAKFLWQLRDDPEASLHDLTVWDKIRQGLTMRCHSAAVKQFAEAYGITKSSLSGHFEEVSRGALDKSSDAHCTVISSGPC